MDGDNTSLCSQTFFVPKRNKNNKLSMSQKNFNPSKTFVKSKCSQSVSRGRLGSTSKLRHGGPHSQLHTMEKYLNRGVKKANSTSREIDCDDNEPINTVCDDIELNGIPCREKPIPDIFASIANAASGSSSDSVSDLTKSAAQTEEASCVPSDTAHLMEFCSNDGSDVKHDWEANEDKHKNSKNNEMKEENSNDSINENIIVLMCPLCWKSYDNKDSQIAHMKACALKNNVPTKQLLEAIDLLHRQEAERQALGLPLLASKVPKKPKKEFSVSSIKPKNASDGYLQLGLALSASLTEAEKEKERDHLLEAGLFEEAEEKGLIPAQDVPEELFAKPAPIFLNVGRRSGDEGRLVNKRRRNTKYGLGKNPTLLKRTEEERERLITEKVAIILVGDENGVPRGNESSNDMGKYHSVWETKSEELKIYVNKENVLWTLASVSPSSVSKNQYYVQELSGFISPSKHVAGSKLMHLSQIPGRNPSPERSVTVQVCEKESRDQSERNSTVLGFHELEPSRVTPSKKPAVKRSLFDQVSKHFEKNKLSSDWEIFMGKSEMSDVTVYTKGDRRIPAHKLVFHVRCPSILNDIITEEIKGSGKSSALLFWSETSFHAAWQFLKYIYCGVCYDLSAMGMKVVEETYELAEKYHVTELLRLLEEKNSFSKVNGLVGNDNPSNAKNSASLDALIPMKDSSLMKYEEFNCEGCVSEIKNHPATSSVHPEASNVTKEPIQSEYRVSEEDSHVENHDKVLDKSSFSPSVSVGDASSPDIFQVSRLSSPDSPMSISVMEEKTENAEKCDNDESSQDSRASIEFLVSLMEKDVEDTSQPYNSPGSQSNNETVEVERNEIAIDTETQEGSAPDIPKTPSFNDTTGELLVYPTPGVCEKTSCRTFSQTTAMVVESPCKDVKRKLVNFEYSESSTPISKKLCPAENSFDLKVKNSEAAGEEEIVDLMLSSPEVEETAEKLNLSHSGTSAIPISDKASHAGTFVNETAVSDDNLSISDRNSFISNVWDDFDHVPEIGQYAPFDNSVMDDSIKCLKKSPIKTFENLENEIVPGDIVEKKSPAKDLNVTETSQTPNTSGSSSKTIENSPKSDDEAVIPGCFVNDEHHVSSDERGDCDITDKLLNASLQKIDNSIFWRDENEPIEVNNENESSPRPCHIPVSVQSHALSSKANTPVNRVKRSSILTESVTPLADYSAMKTPMLNKELDRYGIKHLKRNQAKKILRHIYNELHPIVSAVGETSGNVKDAATSVEGGPQSSKGLNQSQENANTRKKRILFESLDSNSDEQSSEESSSSSSESVILEESMYEYFESPVKNITSSQKVSSVDIPTAMKALIESDPELHRKILLYEPIWLDAIKVSLKEHGAKFNTNQLMNYLDEKCITFRLAQGNRHKRKRPAKKKTFSLSQPCSSKRRNAVISSSQPC